MSNVTKPIILDETGQSIRAVIKEGFSLIADQISPSGPVYGIEYGFHINSGDSNPYTAVTYLKDAVGMTPARMNYLNNKFSYGSWADAFFMPRPCMLKYDGTVDYYLDPNDYDKKEDGTISDIGDSTTGYGVKYQGNAMMEWGRDGQQIWTKVLPDGDPLSGSVYISNKQMDENYVAWPFINNQGRLVNHFYTSIYSGSLTAYKVGNNSYYRLRSIPRRIPMNSPGNNIYDIPWDDDTEDSPISFNDTTRASHEVEFALNNNPSINYTAADTYPSESYFSTNRSSIGWFTEVFCDIQLINILLVLIGKSLNTQDIFGNGNMNGYNSPHYPNTGALYTGSHEYTADGPNYSFLNKSGLFWGSNGDRYAVKVFGMENWWGNQWRRYAGCIGTLIEVEEEMVTTFHYEYLIKNTFGTEDGSNCTGYNVNGDNYIITSQDIPMNGYIKNCKFINNITYNDKICKIGALFANETVDASSGSSQYFCDYSASLGYGTTYAFRGGHASNKFSCGAFLNYVRSTSSGSSYMCACLTFKPIN